MLRSDPLDQVICSLAIKQIRFWPDVTLSFSINAILKYWVSAITYFHSRACETRVVCVEQKNFLAGFYMQGFWDYSHATEAFHSFLSFFSLLPLFSFFGAANATSPSFRIVIWTLITMTSKHLSICVQRFQVHVFDKLKLPSIYNAAAACRSIMYASLCETLMSWEHRVTWVRVNIPNSTLRATGHFTILFCCS